MKIRKRRFFTRILTDRFIEVILTIGYSPGGINITEISRDVKVTYSHVHTKLVPKLVELGLAETQINGRCRYVNLTQKGKEVFKRIAEIGELLDTPVDTSGNRRLDLIAFNENS